MQLLVLALEAALYPTLLAAVVILLSQPRRVQLLSAYLGGGLVVSIGLGLGIIAALEGSGQLKNSQSVLSTRADIVVGGIALLFAVALATRADQRYSEHRKSKHPPKHPPKEADDREPWSQRILSRGSVPIVFFLGIAINVPGAAYLIALKDIAAGNHAVASDIALVVGFNLIMFMLAEIPLVGLVVAPERTDELVNAMNNWLSTNSRRIAIGISAVLGAFLLIRGISNA